MPLEDHFHALPNCVTWLRRNLLLQLGGNTKPTRIRVLDLPFTAVEWVLPGDLATWHSAGSESWMVWERSPLARERSLMGYWDDADDSQIAAAAQGAAEGASAGNAGVCTCAPGVSDNNGPFRCRRKLVG